MAIIQLITVIFVAFAGSRVILRFHDKAIGYGSFFFWSGIWAAVLLVVFNPDIADRTADILSLQRGADAMFFFAIILVFYLIFRLYIKLDALDRDLSRLVEEVSKALHQTKDQDK